MKKAVLTLIVLMCAFVSLSEAHATEKTLSSIKVTAEGLRNSDGKVVLCLWRDDDVGFPRCDRGTAYRKLEVMSGSPSAIFVDVPEGEYAISLFHDEKSTGKIETNFVGLPKSGIGVSGEFLGPPVFSKSRIRVPVKENVVIQVKYLGQKIPITRE